MSGLLSGPGAADPDRAGFDPQRLVRLDGFLRQLTSAGKIPGWSLAVSRNQLPGGADLESFGRPMNAESPLAGVGQRHQAIVG